MDKVLKELYARRLMWMDKYIKEHVANEDLIDCWLENGIYYVDHSFRVDTKKEAIAIGRKHNQISVFGWKRKNLAYC